MNTYMKIIHWAPRILCILAILFVSMFALDSFDPRYTLIEQLQALFFHLIPTYILILILLVAWKWELIGGTILAMLGLGFMPTLYFHNYAMNHSVWMSLSVILMINFPFVLTGAMFIISHYLKKKQQAGQS
ncbi:MAG TPA: hypothetical protein PKG48_03510 [Bacteroidales bacterium]|nr:hypothetical protein [Bacteroidales bacterium]HPS61467.1 hypothetical protein [Bacteroidales bacterium]